MSRGALAPSAPPFCPPTDCSDDSWRDTFFQEAWTRHSLTSDMRRLKNTYLLTYLLTYLVAYSVDVVKCFCVLQNAQQINYLCIIFTTCSRRLGASPTYPRGFAHIPHRGASIPGPRWGSFVSRHLTICYITFLCSSLYNCPALRRVIKRWSRWNWMLTIFTSVGIPIILDHRSWSTAALVY